MWKEDGTTNSKKKEKEKLKWKTNWIKETN